MFCLLLKLMLCYSLELQHLSGDSYIRPASVISTSFCDVDSGCKIGFGSELSLLLLLLIDGLAWVVIFAGVPAGLV